MKYIEENLFPGLNFRKEEIISPTDSVYTQLKNKRQFFLNEINGPDFSFMTKQKFGYKLGE